MSHSMNVAIGMMRFEAVVTEGLHAVAAIVILLFGRMRFTFVRDGGCHLFGQVLQPHDLDKGVDSDIGFAMRTTFLRLIRRIEPSSDARKAKYFAAFGTENWFSSAFEANQTV